MIKISKSGQLDALRSLRLLVEVVETENGELYVIRAENGAPLASSSSKARFLEDLEEIVTRFNNYNTSDDGNAEN